MTKRCRTALSHRTAVVAWETAEQATVIEIRPRPSRYVLVCNQRAADVDGNSCVALPDSRRRFPRDADPSYYPSVGCANQTVEVETGDKEPDRRLCRNGTMNQRSLIPKLTHIVVTSAATSGARADTDRGPGAELMLGIYSDRRPAPGAPRCGHSSPKCRALPVGKDAPKCIGSDPRGKADGMGHRVETPQI